MTAEAGVSYAQSCLESASDPTSAWSSDLKPNTDCTGTPDSSSAYVQDQTDPKSPRYRTSFAVQPVATGSDNIPKAKTVGTVEVLAASSGTVTKTYTSETTVILNVSGGGGGGSSGGGIDPSFSGSVGGPGFGICILESDNNLYCKGPSAPSTTKFNLPSGVTVKDWGLYGYGAPTVPGNSNICVLGTNNLFYCTGSTTGIGGGVNPFGIGGGAAPYPVSPALPKPFSTSAGNPVQVKSIRGAGNQTQPVGGFGDTICVISLVDTLYCAGVNQGGLYGNNTTNNNSWAKPAFTVGPYFNDPSLKIKSLVSVQTYAGAYAYQSFGLVPMCVLAGTTATDTQVYCAGACTNDFPLGTALYGSGQKGCYDSYYNDPPSTVYNNVTPFDCGNYLKCYKKPVKFILPPSAGYVVEAYFYITDGSAYNTSTKLGGLCAKASNDHTYCTGGVTETSEPFDLESL